MRLLFTLLAALLASVLLGWLLQRVPGQLIIVYGEWTLQTSLAVLVAGALALLLLFFFLARLTRKLPRLPSIEPGRWAEDRRRRRSARAAAQRRANAERLTRCVERLRQAGGERPALEQAWRAVPGRLKRDSRLLRAYVTERLRHEDQEDCEGLLRHALRKKWDPELTRLFGLVDGKDLKRQLDFAEKHLARFPEDAALLLTLGRLCKKNRLWGKARAYLTQSLDAQASPEASLELATLLEQQGASAEAARHYRQGLNAAVECRLEAGPDSSGG